VARLYRLRLSRRQGPLLSLSPSHRDVIAKGLIYPRDYSMSHAFRQDSPAVGNDAEALSSDALLALGRAARQAARAVALAPSEVKNRASRCCGGDP
jgi:hypothetical protein